MRPSAPSGADLPHRQTAQVLCRPADDPEMRSEPSAQAKASRPSAGILSTVGHTPLILATGPGAGARNSIGIVLVSGMVIGTLFTLFVVPSIYMLVSKPKTLNPSRERHHALLGDTPARIAIA